MTASELERLLHHMPTLAERGRTPWARQFCSDMAVRARWRNWKPTEKQSAMMEKLIAEFFEPSRSMR